MPLRGVLVRRQADAERPRRRTVDHRQHGAALAVEGKYLVGGKDFNEQLSIADKLIAKSRSEKPGKK